MAVGEGLIGAAAVYRPAVNCAHSRNGVANLKIWMAEHGPEPWDLIHVNFGLHDLDVKGQAHTQSAVRCL